MAKISKVALIVVVICFLWASPVMANPLTTENARVSLVSEVQSIQPDSSFWVAVHFQLRKGWHIYWQNPGDSGAKPTLRWQLPEGFTAGELQFPYPKRFLIPPLANFGYEGEIYLPVQLRSPAKLVNPVALRLRADWLICQQECIPESGQLSLTLPVGDGSITPEQRALFDEIRRSLPQPTLQPLTFTATPQEITLNLQALGNVQSAEFFPYEDGIIVNSAQQKFSGDRQTLTLQRGYQTDLKRVAGVLVVQQQGQTRGLDIQAQPSAPPSESTGFGEAMVLALVGGIVLNFMPCVLPILSLRALSILRLAQQSPPLARWSGLVFTAGVLLCFGAIAIVLLILRALGQQVGWGFQLQSPLVVLSLAYLLFAVGLNLSGVYVLGSGITGVGQKLAGKGGLAGEFFTGVLAVLMSTPCTAPFMATAIGAALVLPPALSLLILLTLGLGFALPYLLLCFVPALQKLLPKPGAWLEVLPQVLAFPVYGTAGWMLWVFTLQTGSDGLAIALVGLLLIGFACWLYGKTQQARQFWRRVGIVGVGGCLTLTLLVLAWVAQPTPWQEQGWEPYSSDRLGELRQQGRPVFINFTAAWCISCLINERTTLSQPEVKRAFQQHQVVLLKADWTNRSSEITAALQQFGSSGVPLYLLYGANIEPVVLPKTLTPQIVQEALAKYVPLS
jgi:thiol:disulfide interchange protein DsbD